MALIDLRDAYLCVPIAPQSQKFLRMTVKMGKEVLHLQFKVLPLGLSSTPQIFTKVMAEALAPLRLQGIAVIPYLDDLPFFAPSREKLQEDLDKAPCHLEALGFLLRVWDHSPETLGTKVKIPTRFKRTLLVVEKSFNFVKRLTMVFPDLKKSDNRCQQVGMGGPLQSESSARSLVLNQGS